jgi:hypothetical protein
MNKNWTSSTMSDGIIVWEDEEGNLRKMESDDYICYYDQDEQIHRSDGPARVFSGGNMNEFYFHGEKIECDNLEEFKRLVKLKSFW